jgi:CheY-like chemotaxis protein
MKKKLLHILLVEDDEVDIINVQRAFIQNKILNPLVVAKNGVEALEMLRSDDVDKAKPNPGIILLDINMPRMGGIEFLKNLRADEKLKSISVFVMTTSSEEQDKVAAYDLNVAGYILKPLSFESFVNVTSVLNSYWGLCEHI